MSMSIKISKTGKFRSLSASISQENINLPLPSSVRDLSAIRIMRPLKKQKC